VLTILIIKMAIIIIRIITVIIMIIIAYNNVMTFVNIGSISI